MDLATMAALIERFGVPVVITAIFVIDSRLRERRMSARLNVIEDREVNKLADVIGDNTVAMQQCFASRAAETARVTAEALRVTSEASRVAAEMARVSSEELRKAVAATPPPA